jgi:hypothetical protein
MTCLNLRPGDKARGAPKMSPGAYGFRPWLRGQAVGHSRIQQAVPGGMEVHFVDPVTLW